MRIDKSRIRRILFVSLSNLGDIILTTPVFSELVNNFPGAEIDVITGDPGEEIFSLHPSVKNIMRHGEHRTFSRRISRVLDLRKIGYDMVVDLKSSMLPYFIGASYRNSPIRSMMNKCFAGKRPVLHKVQEHLYKLKAIDGALSRGAVFFMPFAPGDEDKAADLMARGKGRLRKVIINPGAKSHLKRWPAEKFAKLSEMLINECECDIFITGTADDYDTRDIFMDTVTEPVLDICGETSLGTLAVIMKRADLVITNDSAPLHLASSVNAPTVAIFGPTDERKYGPLSEKKRVVKPEKKCRPCEKALCAIGPDEGCITEVSVEAVYRAAKELLAEEEVTWEK